MQDSAPKCTPQEIKFIRQTLTGVLVDINAVLGLEAALKVAKHYGGKHLYLRGAAQRARRGALTQLLGQDATEHLIARMAARNIGGQVDVPHGPYAMKHMFRWRAIKLFAAGKSASYVAQKLRMPRTTAKYWRCHFLADYSANENARPSANDNAPKRPLIKAAGDR